MANNTLLASDNFASGSLAAGWSSQFGLSEGQVISGSPNVVEANATSTEAGQIWTGLTWPEDQVCEVTVGTITPESGGSTSAVILKVRWQSGVQSGYQVNLVGSGGNSTAILYSTTAGSSTQLASAAVTYTAGDIWTLMAAGCSLILYQNYKQVLRYMDTTYTSGFPGFSCYSSVNIAHAQVRSWRGYNAIQQDGIWQKQGIVLPAISSDFTTGSGGQANTTMLYESNAQVLSGSVYKMWFSGGGPTAETNVYYAESSDGIHWTRYSGGAVLSSYGSPFVIKNGSTYYMYVQPSASAGAGAFAVYTSTNGINWAQQATNILTLGSGTWDDALMWYMQPVAITNGTWYALYSAGSNATTYQLSLGLATSPDGINWTKYIGNPVLQGVNSGSVVNSSALAQVGSIYYMWMFGNQPGFGASEANLDPGEGIRYQTTDFIHWTNPVHSVHRTQIYEGVNFSGGQSYPNSIFTVGSQTYMYVQAAVSDNASPYQYQISLAIAPATIAQIVQFNENATSQIALDGFTSGSGSLDSNWTVPSGAAAAKIVAGPYVEPVTLGSSGTEVYTGSSFSADQYSEVTLQTMFAVSVDVVAVTVRNSLIANTCYQMNIIGPLASAGSATIYRTVAGASTQLGPSQIITPQQGDIIRLSVVGNVLTAFQNGYTILQVEDVSNTITSGNPGFQVYASNALADCQISSWAGGNANVIPPYPNPTPGFIGWSPIDSRVAVTGFGPGPNVGVADEQGNEIFSATNPPFTGNSQTSCNSTIPPVDSRVSKPVDSRVNIPVNSRVAPPFGEAGEP